MYKLFGLIIIFAMIIDKHGDIALPWNTPLAWDDKDYSERGCTFPNGILFPGHLIVVIVGFNVPNRFFKFFY